jgi:hypothetical protein
VNIGSCGLDYCDNQAALVREGNRNQIVSDLQAE